MVTRTATSILSALCLAALLMALPVAADIHYVSTSGNDNNDGLSWQNAELTIGAAITAAASGDDVWVKTGTYTECITLKAGVGLYGGFVGTENTRSQRDWNANVTTLDGTFGNSSVVTVPSGATSTTVIDGFTITNGVGTLIYSTRYGGGIYCHDSSPRISNNVVIGNTADSGGGVYVRESSPTIAGNLIVDNAATAGGGVSYQGDSGDGGDLCSNTISDNAGSGVYVDASAPAISNNVITFSSAYGVYSATNTQQALSHNCVHGNMSGSYLGTQAGTGDISEDPDFVDSDNGDYHLLASSPCIDAGYDDAVEYGMLDMDGEERIRGNHVEIGADESLVYVSISAPSSPITDGGPITYTVTYVGASEITLSPSDITPSAGGTASYTNATVTGSGTETRTITLSGLAGDGLIGMHIEAGTATDAAGNEAPTASSGSYLTVDNTAPTTPTVTDDGAYSTATNSLNASWTAATDANGVTGYRYAVGILPQLPEGKEGGFLIPWTSAGTSTSATISNLALNAGWTYYIYVQAGDAVGNWSTPGVSDGIMAGTSLVTKDFVAGIGDFEWAGDTAYFGPSNGVEDADDGDRIGTGWCRTWGYATNQATNLCYDLASDTYAGGNGNSMCQYFGLKGTIPRPAGTQGSYYALAYLWIRKSIPVNDSNPRMLHVGDVVTFSLDRVRSTYQPTPPTLPPGVSVSFRIGIGVAGVGQYTANATTGTVSTAALPSGATGVDLYLKVEISANESVQSIDLSGIEPGLWVDGAHLTATRSGTSVSIESPLCKRRTIATNSVGYYGASDQSFFYSSIEDPDYLARAYDWMMLGEDAYFYGPRLRAANPDIKLYLYESADAMDPLGSYYSNSPLDFNDVMTNGDDWLYTDLNNDPPYVEDPDNSYFSHLENSSYQAAWAQSTLDKIDNYRFDGVFIDVCSWLPYIDDLTGREPSDCQSFLHYMVDTFSNEEPNDYWNSECPVVIQNNPPINFDYDNWTPDPPLGSILCDPTWQAGGNWPTPAYEDNSGHITDTYSEYTFFTHDGTDIHYDRVRWKAYLDSMGGYGAWTRSIPLHCNLWADANESSAPGGKDGWVQFGLCSYLLGQNDYTTFGVVRGLEFDYAAAFDKTKDYPTPAGTHQSIDSNDYFRYRDYYGNDGGARGGIVVVNADSASASEYYDYSPLVDMLDEDNVWCPYGTSVEVDKNRGRMLFNSSNYRYISVVTSPSHDAEIDRSEHTDQGVFTYDVVVAVRNNRSNPTGLTKVQVAIDDPTDWHDCTDNQNGTYTFEWSSANLSTGDHFIYSRVYGSSTDYEPEKPARVCNVVE